MARWWILALAMSSGCTAQRYLILPEPLVAEAPAPGPWKEQTWRVGEVTTRVEVSTAQGAAAADVDVEQLQRQLTDRVRSTLTAQSALGAVQGAATHALEVELGAREAYGLGKGLALGIGLELGIIAAGAGVGAGVGVATAGTSDRGLAALVGSQIGVLAALPVALVAALLADIGGVRGEYLATLTLRRLSDRVPVATRRLSSAWRADYNGFGAADKIAKASGNAVPDFERVLLEGVKSMLLEVNEPLARAAP
ncbi:MAG: hypothetical protein IAE78_29645 [Myxococcus sp.]|nr:hypothetical protein [Myxococcus sp.]